MNPAWFIKTNTTDKIIKHPHLTLASPMDSSCH